LKRDGRFAGAGRAGQQGAGASVRATAEQRVQRGNAARDQRWLELQAMLGGDQSREDG
jgi:hypothetical protein